MDYNKIGKFIEEERKNKKLTQAKLAEKIFVSEKTISKWENGKGIPDTTSLVKLCEVLEISLNELLNGERGVLENKENNEQLLLNMAKELEMKNRTIWTSMWVIMIVSMISLFSGIVIAAFLIPDGIWKVITIISLVILFLIPCFYALKLEISVGVYKCKKCGHEIIPSYSTPISSFNHSCLSAESPANLLAWLSNSAFSDHLMLAFSFKLNRVIVR